MLNTSSTLSKGFQDSQPSLATCIKPRDKVHLHVKNNTIQFPPHTSCQGSGGLVRRKVAPSTFAQLHAESPRSRPDPPVLCASNPGPTARCRSPTPLALQTPHHRKFCHLRANPCSHVSPAYWRRGQQPRRVWTAFVSPSLWCLHPSLRSVLFGQR